MTDTKPVAWMYRCMTTAEADHVAFTKVPWSSLPPRWTETPLYAQPCTDCAALRDEVERLRKELARATKFIGAQKHTKRGYEAFTRARAALNGGKHD